MLLKGYSLISESLQKAVTHQTLLEFHGTRQELKRCITIIVGSTLKSRNLRDVFPQHNGDFQKIVLHGSAWQGPRRWTESVLAGPVNETPFREV